MGGWVGGWMQFTPISVVGAKNTGSVFTFTTALQCPITASLVTPPKGPWYPHLPPLGNCQIQPAEQGPPAATASHRCNTASPPGCLSEVAGKIDALSSCACQRDAGINNSVVLLHLTPHSQCINIIYSVSFLHLTPHSQCINIIYNVSFLHLTPHSQCIWILFIMYSYRVPSQWLIKWYSFWDCFWVTDVLWTLNEIGLWGNVVVH